MAGRISLTGHIAMTQKQLADTKFRWATASDADGGPYSELGRKDRRTAREQQETALSSSNQLARLGSILRSEDPLERAHSLLAYIDRLNPNDFEAALAHLDSLPITGYREGDYNLLLCAWAKNDPFAALAYTEKNALGQSTANNILATWAVSDTEGAMRWAEAHNKSNDGANPYIAGIIRGIAATDPDRAYQLLTDMPKSLARTSAIDAIMPFVLSQGSESARTWISSLSDDSLRNGAVRLSAKQLADVDPAGTAAWLTANPCEASDDAMAYVYQAWAKTNTDEAIQSFSALPTGETRSMALDGLIKSMTSRDQQGAIALLDQYPDDVSPDCVKNFIWDCYQTDPEFAMSQISRLRSENAQMLQQQQILDVWIQRDPAAAEAWIQNNQ